MEILTLSLPMPIQLISLNTRAGASKAMSELNRKEFYSLYRQARFLMSARALYAVTHKVNAPDGTMLINLMESLPESVLYAVMNQYKNTIYPIKENKWAIGHNHKF